MKNIRTYLYGTAGLVILYIDSITPLGFGVWLSYVILLFIFIRHAPVEHIIFVTIFYLILLTTGYFVSPPAAAIPFTPIVNRIGAGIVLLFFALLGYNEKRLKQDKAEILERINDLFIMIDKSFNLQFMNASAKKYNDLNDEVTGKHYFEVFPEIKNTLFEEKLKESLNTRINQHFEGELPENKYLDFSLYPSDKGISIFAKDITHRVTAEKNLKKLLKEKEILLKEVHHRTKNNLQLMLSLLNLQINKLDNETIIRILNETRARLLSLAKLHDKLQVHGDIYNIDMQTFIEDIIVKMETAANFGLVKISHQIEIDSVKLKMDTAIPIALIINELYTNSLKYAFADKENALVTIKLYFDNAGSLIVYYKDNGKGFPKGFSLYDSEGLGSSIILAFVDQLDGKITYKNGDGAEFVIRIPAPVEEEEAEKIII
jgi:two-component sensor histidine kinase